MKPKSAPAPEDFYEFHEYAAMFPVLVDEEFKQLVEDIKEHGQRELIVLLDNKILDGRNRYNACRALGIKPRFRDFNCTDGDPLAYVWSANVTRRHLSESQRAMAVAKRVNFLTKEETALYAGGFRYDKDPASRRPASKTMVNEAAELANVSPRQIDRAKAVLKYGTPEEIESIERGESKIYPIAERAIRRANNQPIPDMPTPYGKHVKIPIPFGKTPEAFVREALKREKNGEDVFRSLNGIGDNSYRKMREIVLIFDRPDLSPRDREAADRAMKILNDDRQLINSYPLIEHISQRIWGDGNKSDKIAQNRVDEFEKRIEILAHTCEAEIEVPQLSLEQVKYAVERLEDSVKGLRRTINKLKEVNYD